ncbi:L,D-transpeptidase family protein [Streptomyces alboflavus]|uniref:L,D-transpeptidase family protein n=1 Tax=Streptomyces alboflavus TaxID=67267 RepID=UPI0004C16AF0|nr:L,D-transpeptidase family protein [Streptomyces alboflavus]
MRIAALVRTAAAAAACSVLLTSCGGSGDDGDRGDEGAARKEGRTDARAGETSRRIPDVGDRLQARIPKNSRQVVAVYGEGRNSADATVVLYTRTDATADAQKPGTGKSGADASGPTWKKTRSWPAHNGKKGWTPDHRENDKRSPVGVFTLHDAGGVLADPGSRLPYTESAAFQAPHYWPKTHWHDFDHVIAIDYNRVKGTPPNDPTRPQGQRKGGSIWLHMDHGSGTSGCVSLSKSGMRYLLRTLDPKLRPVVVMGDKASLRG